MNPLLALQNRVRDILVATPTFAGCTVLVEDKEGLAFDLESALTTLSAPLVIVGSVSGAKAQSAQGAVLLMETLTVSILYRPLIAAQAAADAPLPSDLLNAAIVALHDAPLNPDDLAPGYPAFAVQSHALTDTDSRDGLVTQTINLQSPLTLP